MVAIGFANGNGIRSRRVPPTCAPPIGLLFAHFKSDSSRDAIARKDKGKREKRTDLVGVVSFLERSRGGDERVFCVLCDGFGGSSGRGFDCSSSGSAAVSGLAVSHRRRKRKRE